MQRLPEKCRDEFLTAIVTYGTAGEYTISDAVAGACFAQCKASIDSSRKRYADSKAAGKLGGRPREIDRDFILRMHKKNYTARQIAEMANCHVRSVQRIIWEDKHTLEDMLFEKRRKYNPRPKNMTRIDFYMGEKAKLNPFD